MMSGSTSYRKLNVSLELKWNIHFLEEFELYNRRGKHCDQFPTGGFIIFHEVDPPWQTKLAFIFNSFFNSPFLYKNEKKKVKRVASYLVLLTPSFVNIKEEEFLPITVFDLNIQKLISIVIRLLTFLAYYISTHPLLTYFLTYYKGYFSYLVFIAHFFEEEFLILTTAVFDLNIQHKKHW